MDKTGILCDRNSEMLHEYARRCMKQITGHALPSASFVASYLEANIAKEADKDKLIIEHAASAVASGKRMENADIENIFQRTKEVDHEFVKKLLLPSLSINVHYDEIGPVRKERIAFLSRAVEDVLNSWGAAPDFSGAVKKTCDRNRFRYTIATLLHLYNEETRMLSGSIRFLPPFNKAMDLFIETLVETMEDVKEDLADACTISVFGEVRRS